MVATTSEIDPGWELPRQREGREGELREGGRSRERLSPQECDGGGGGALRHGPGLHDEGR